MSSDSEMCLTQANQPTVVCNSPEKLDEFYRNKYTRLTGCIVLKPTTAIPVKNSITTCTLDGQKTLCVKVSLMESHIDSYSYIKTNQYELIDQDMYGYLGNFEDGLGEWCPTKEHRQDNEITEDESARDIEKGKLSEPELTKFVGDFIKAINSRDVNRIVSYYSDPVEYNDNKYSQAELRDQIKEFYDTWQRVNVRIIGNIKIASSKNTAEVSYKTQSSLESTKYNETESQSNSHKLIVVLNDGKLQIVSQIREITESGEKGISNDNIDTEVKSEISDHSDRPYQCTVLRSNLLCKSTESLMNATEYSNLREHYLDSHQYYGRGCIMLDSNEQETVWKLHELECRRLTPTDVFSKCMASALEVSCKKYIDTTCYEISRSKDTYEDVWFGYSDYYDCD